MEQNLVACHGDLLSCLIPKEMIFFGIMCRGMFEVALQSEFQSFSGKLSLAVDGF